MKKLIKLLIVLFFLKSFYVVSVYKEIVLLVVKFICFKIDVNRLGL